jgi:hypothetical protein
MSKKIFNILEFCQKLSKLDRLDLCVKLRILNLEALFHKMTIRQNDEDDEEFKQRLTCEILT